MKNFLRRLRFFGIGFGIGMVFVFFFFQNRGCTWLPSNRVKNTFLGRIIVIQDEQARILKKHGISERDIIGFLNDGDIDFGASKKQGNPQVYGLTKDFKGKDVELWFTLPKNGYISEIQWPQGSIQLAKNSTTGIGKMIHFPNVESFVYIDSNKRLTCQQEKTGLIAPKQIIDCLKKSGTIDFEKSHLKVKPFPEHYIYFNDRKRNKIGTQTTWYQEHIRIFEFDMKDTTGCN